LRAARCPPGRVRVAGTAGAGPAGAAGAGAVVASALVALLAGASAAAAVPLGLFRDGPPAAVTGGFGEDSCHACHWGDDVNDPGGALRLLGVPKRFEAGEAYSIEVVLARPDMKVGGFQLAVRFSDDGNQAGTVKPGPEEEERVAVLEQGGVQYVQHRLEGITLPAPGTARWMVVWTAPEEGNPVSFHVSAVAGDDDESQIGDFVYTEESRSRPAGEGKRPDGGG